MFIHLNVLSHDTLCLICFLLVPATPETHPRVAGNSFKQKSLAHNMSGGSLVRLVTAEEPAHGKLLF